MPELWRLMKQTKDSNGAAQVTSGFMWAWPSRRMQHFVSQLRGSRSLAVALHSAVSCFPAAGLFCCLEVRVVRMTRL